MASNGEQSLNVIVIGQLEESKGNAEAAREAYKMGTRNCPTATSLWVLYSQLEDRTASLAIARSVLEKVKPTLHPI